MVRPGPTESATKFEVGKKKKGNDGRIWIVAETTAGIHRWQRVRPAVARKPAGRKPATAADLERAHIPHVNARFKPVAVVGHEYNRARRSATKTHRIMFCGPYTTSGRIAGGVKFTVSDEFYPILLRAPKKYQLEHHANAYMFGRRFPLDQYVYLGKHENDGAQTGFINIDLYDPGWQKDGEDIGDAYRGVKFDWSDRAALRKVRAKVPHMMFIGQTVGAKLFVHRTGGGG